MVTLLEFGDPNFVNYPFYAEFVFAGGGYTDYTVTCGEGTHQFELYYVVDTEIIHTIAPEYLPESAIAQEVIISDTEPTDETAEIWINTSEEWNDNIPEQVQADLNQTDESAPDYVKGTVDHTRLPEGYPYKEQSETVLLAEQTLPFGDLNGLMMSYADVDIPFSVDQTYKVVWDGTEYICTAYLHEGGVGIGDSSFSGGPATDDPFSMTTYMEKLMVVAHDDAAEHTFSISEYSETIHTMAPEFLPEGVGGGGHILNTYMDLSNGNIIPVKSIPANYMDGVDMSTIGSGVFNVPWAENLSVEEQKDWFNKAFDGVTLGERVELVICMFEGIYRVPCIMNSLGGGSIAKRIVFSVIKPGTTLGAMTIDVTLGENGLEFTAK